jgi:ribosomal protein S6--L-glutamate ligase
VLSHSESFYTTRRLMEEARRSGCAVTRIDPTRVTLSLHAREPIFEDGAALPVPDILIPRVGATLTEWGLALLRALRCAGSWSPASAEAMALAQDKLGASLELRACGVPVLPTVALREPAHIADALHQLETSSYVIKRPRGTQGRGVMSSPDISSARALLEGLLVDQGITLAQPLIAQTSPKDLRVLVIGGRAYAACWRHAAAGEFRSNVHLGGSTTQAELSAPIAKLAERAAAAVELPVCGVDLIETPNGLAVLEVNGSPGIEGMEAATDLNIAGEMISWMVLQWRNC